MQRYILRRFLQGILLLFGVAVVVFYLSRATGDPLAMMLPPDATLADREHMIRALGLDQPYYVQFFNFISGAVRGDFGDSIRFGRPALEVFLERLPSSLALVGISWVFALTVGILLAVLAAVNKDKLLDTVAQVIAVAGMAAPPFWVGLVLIQIFGVYLQILPVARIGGPSHYVLPVITLGLFQVAGVMRLLRSSMLDVLDSDFVKLARIKGATERAVVWKHCLRNAMIPVVSFAALYIAILITGAIVVETVFAWPGVGRLAYQAILFRDFPLTQTVVILNATFVLVLNLIADILYAFLDPRLRQS